MTPEDRAQAMLRAIEHYGCVCPAAVVKAAEFIAAAENEALERAAERLARTMVTRQDVVLWAIETVRSLKRPEAA